MILRALTEYYDRKAADPDSGIARPGWEWKEIPYLIIIQGNGSFVHVEDTQEFVGKKKRAKTFLVPQSVKRSSGVASNLLWDNVEYATGIVCKGKKERVSEQHKAFLERLNGLSTLPAVKSVCAFLANSENRRKLSDDPVWKEAVDTCAFVSFRIVDQQEPVFRQRDVVEAIDNMGMVLEDDVAGGRCLVSGDLGVIAKLHPAIKGVQGANTTGGNIVSFNFPASCSFGKKQGENAPISELAAFKYTTALKSLLSKDSRQKMSVGDATVVFWSEKKTALEDEFIDLFGEPAKDDPDKGVAAVERLLASVKTGAFSSEMGVTRFYVLGLAPNSARISVRFWHVGTVAEMEGRFADWFDNLRIVHGPGEKKHLSLWRLLVSIAPLGKSENIPPNLAGAVMRSILEGTPYPATLLSSAIVRIKAGRIKNDRQDRETMYSRCKLIKAFLNHNKERNSQ